VFAAACLAALLAAAGRASGEGRAPWKFAGETRFPSMEAITGRVRFGDTTENAAWTLVLMADGELRLYQTYPLRTARKLGDFPDSTLAAVSRKGKYAVVAAREGVMCLPLDGGDPLGPLAVDPQETRALDVSDSGVAAVAARGRILLYDFPAGKALASAENSGTACRIRDEWAVFGTADGSVMLYDLKDGKRRFAVRVGVRQAVVGVDVTAKGDLAAAALERASGVLLLKGEDGSKTAVLEPEGVDFFPGRPILKDCALSADGAFAAASYAGKYALFDLFVNKITGVCSTENNVQGRIRIVGERPTIFCCRTLTFREHQGGIYNALPDPPTLDLTAPPDKLEGVRAICYAPKADVFVLFLQNGRIEKLAAGARKRTPLPFSMAKGEPAVAPGGKRVLVRLAASLWLLGGQRGKRATIPLEDGEVLFGFCGDARFFAARGKKADFYDSRGKPVVSADLPFEPRFAEGLQGRALFADESGRWAVVSLPAGTVESGKLEMGEKAVVAGLSNGGALVVDGIEGSYYRPRGGEMERLFRLPLGRGMTAFAVSAAADWIAYRTQAGAFVREVKTARSMRLPQAADYSTPAFSRNGRKLYFYSPAGIAAFRR